MCSNCTILLIADFRKAYSRDLFGGIGEYIHQCTDLRVSAMDVRTTSEFSPGAHGVILGSVVDVATFEQVASLNIPVVTTSAAPTRTDVPLVTVDDSAVGALAAEYLIGLGMRALAVSGGPQRRTPWASARVEGFLAACQRYKHPAKELASMDPKQVARQLRSLAPPVGLYCAHDAHAAWAVNACHEAGLAVPDEVAILGTDNDLISCELAPVGLSSIQLPGKQIGRRAIEVLHAMIDGSPRPTQAERIAPAGVVVRQSTRVLAGDPCVRSAQEYIRRHVSRPTSVEDVLAELDVSRSLLQQRFRAALGRTPLQEIHHVHIEHAKTLLVQTDLPTTRIAELAGFASYPRFAVAFKKLTATTPGEYRRQFPRAPG